MLWQEQTCSLHCRLFSHMEFGDLQNQKTFEPNAFHLQRSVWRHCCHSDLSFHQIHLSAPVTHSLFFIILFLSFIAQFSLVCDQDDHLYSALLLWSAVCDYSPIGAWVRVPLPLVSVWVLQVRLVISFDLPCQGQGFT